MKKQENGEVDGDNEILDEAKPLDVQKFATLAPISTKQRTKPNPNPNFNSGISNRYNSKQC
ncbi:hypothetical protein Hanom_Chr13g01186181 [Helianthus anomalus]